MRLLPWFKPFLDEYQRLYSSGRWPHAILLSARFGCDIDNLTNFLAQSILCETKAINLCGQCRNCKLLSSSAQSHPDLIVIEPEGLQESIKVETIRGLQNSLLTKSGYAQKTIVVIRQAHSMNESAANALLKILEEPNDSIFFILSSNEVSLIIPTVRSRVQVYDLKIKIESIKPWIKSQMLAHHFDESRVTFDLLCRISSNAPGHIIAIIKDKQILDLRDKFFLTVSKNELFIETSEYSSKMDPNWVIYWWFTLITDLIHLKVDSANIEQVINYDQITLLLAYVENKTLSTLFSTYNHLLKIKKMYLQHINLNKQLMYENLWLTMFGENNDT